MIPRLRCTCHRAVRTTSPRLIVGCSFSSSVRFLAAPPARAPTFTTPEPSAPVDDFDPTKPLPPTNLPIEDYASPLAHTYEVFAKLFRYAVFGSVGIVTLGISGLVGVHLWVENVELAQAKLLEGDLHHWEDELEGWSGAHSGGGTDQRLGTTIRSAIRGAWIAQNWGTGGIGSPVSSSPFAVNGGTMIGVEPTKIDDAGEIGDAGWQQSEGYLLYAIDNAARRGISLCSPGEPTTGESIDRAAFELEERLASLRELIGGRFKLQAARDGWERIYYALSSTTSPTPWDIRQRTRATKKLGDISARLAEMFPPGSGERRYEMNKAEGWLLGGLLPVVGTGQEMSIVADKKSSGASTGFLGLFSRSSSNSSTTVRPEIRALVDALSHHSVSPTPAFDPATARTLLNSLVTLETFLARDRSLAAAQSVQSASLDFARSLSPTPLEQVRTTSVIESSSDKAAALYQMYIIVRTALFATHLAEVTLALGQSNGGALELLEGAIRESGAVKSTLGDAPLTKAVSLVSSSKDAMTQRRLGKSGRDIVRDATLTEAIARQLLEYVESRK